jgi:LacI family transcriptional regulator
MDISDTKTAAGPAAWRGPTIKAIARASGVGTATVDRVLNGRPSVRPTTRDKVLEALGRLSGPTSAGPRHRIAVLTDSGVSFGQTLKEAVDQHRATHPRFECRFTAIESAEVDPITFAQLIERATEESEGLIVVAREDLTINRAIRAVVARGIPVVCVTTDLPNSGRTAYVGSDQTMAGATAAHLMGRVIGERPGKILLVVSAPFRCQEERELGFRRVLRSEFSQLEIDERVNSKDLYESSYANVRKYIEDHGAPVGVYNVAGGNRGVARALDDAGLKGKVLFIGHELNVNSRVLLESGGMDFVIGHDVPAEIAMSVAEIEARLDGKGPVNAPHTKVQIHTKYSCN